MLGSRLRFPSATGTLKPRQIRYLPTDTSASLEDVGEKLNGPNKENENVEILTTMFPLTDSYEDKATVDIP